MKDPNEPLQALQEYAFQGIVFARFAQTIAYGGDPARFTYAEPGTDSIEEIDARLGSDSDVPDPLLTAHRMIRFHLLSAGDAIYSLSGLLRGSSALRVGTATLGRTAVEHLSRAMFLGESEINYRQRIQRTATLMEKGINEYRPSMPDHAIANSLVQQWTHFMARNRLEFKGLKAEKVSQYSALVEKYFPKIGYVELSRPSHGNAIWVTLTVISEQQGGGASRVYALRNLAYCLDCLVTACDTVVQLWSLDIAAVERQANDDGPEPMTWNSVLQLRDSMLEIAESFEPRDYADFVDNPHPYGTSS